MQRFLLLSLLSLYFSFSYTFGKNPGSAKNDYLPYIAGTRLYYSGNLGDIKTEVTGQGNMLYIRNDGEKFKYDQDFSLTDHGLRLQRVYQKIKVMAFITKEATTTYKTPLLRFPWDIAIGKSWNGTTLEYSHGDTATTVLNGSVVGEETITVSAGTFKTLKVITVFSHPNGAESRVTDWICPGIGIIKSRLQMSGDGLTGFIRNVLGYSEILFELKKWEKI